jgi:oligopeptidase B
MTHLIIEGGTSAMTHDKAAFETIRAYSPRSITCWLSTILQSWRSRASPIRAWEPAKWVARLRATMTGGGPILLRTAMDAGHARVGALRPA